MAERRKTKVVDVGGVRIGSPHPVSIQSMTKTDTQDIASTVSQINELEEAGCEIVRVAVKDNRDAKAISSIKKETHLPLVADIHFDYKLALEAIKEGADKIRINPGNIKTEEEVSAVIDAAKEKDIPIRLGMNSGSLEEVIRTEEERSDKMVEEMLKYLEAFEKRNFQNIVLSLKFPTPSETVEAYRKMAAKSDYPFHLGVTASGPLEEGIVKSSIGIGTLLMEGIGDTIRVSLTGDPLYEVDAAKRILSSSGCRDFGPEIISCPTCGRCQVDLVSIVKELEEELKGDPKYSISHTDKQITIAIMGCEVNGPGEAKSADIGIAFGKGKGAIFKGGKVIKTIEVDSAIKELLDIIREET